MSSFIRLLLCRLSLLQGFCVGSVLTIFILGVACGILCMVLFPALYLRMSDHLVWRFRLNTPAQVQLEKSLISVHLQGDPLIPSGSILLFGDSHLHRLPTSLLLAPAQNYAISGETARRLADRVARYGSIRRARQVIVLTGRNDLSVDAPSSAIAASIGTVLALIPSTARIVLLGIPPAADPASRIEARRETNALIEKLCAIRSGCRFVSLDAFADERGRLRPQFDAGDGMHLNLDTYRVIGQMLASLHSAQSHSLREGEK